MSWGQTHAWGTCFAELQTGVAPTQSHSFPLEAHSEHQHCEVFKPLAGLTRPADLYSDNYSAAVGAVDAWAESDAGLPEAHFHELRDWIAQAGLPPLSRAPQDFF